MGTAEDILNGIRTRHNESNELSEEERAAAKIRTSGRLERIKAALSDPDGLDGYKFDQAMEAVKQEENQ